MSAAPMLTLVVDTTDAHAKTLRAPASPFTWSLCVECCGTGTVTETRGAQLDRDVRCVDCDGTGLDPAGMYEVHEDTDGLTHVWASERSFDADEPAACGARWNDTRLHRVSEDEHCDVCWNAMQAAKKAAGR